MHVFYLSIHVLVGIQTHSMGTILNLKTGHRLVSTSGDSARQIWSFSLLRVKKKLSGLFKFENSHAIKPTTKNSWGSPSLIMTVAWIPVVMPLASWSHMFYLALSILLHAVSMATKQLISVCDFHNHRQPAENKSLACFKGAGMRYRYRYRYIP